jgi:ADP-ribosylglycohydrolase
MLGAIAGDIIGSVYEGWPHKATAFPLFTHASTFTDDSVLTIATAETLLWGRPYEETYREFGRRYPHAGYGGTFLQWVFADAAGPYGSWGNGSAMRVSPIAWACQRLDDVLAEAARSAVVTHNHPEGIKGAQAVAAAVFLARTGSAKGEIRREVSRRFGYDLDRRVDEIRPSYGFDISCQGSVPEALVCFLDSENFEEAVRLAVSLGGDADTQACIAGAVAEAFYGGVSEAISAEVRSRLPEELRSVVRRFRERFVVAEGRNTCSET